MQEQLQCYLRFANFYQLYISGTTSFAAALATAKVPFQWFPAMDQAFQMIILNSALQFTNLHWYFDTKHPIVSLSEKQNFPRIKRKTTIAADCAHKRHEKLQQ